MKPHIVINSKDKESQIRSFLDLTKGLTHSLTKAETDFAVELIKRCQVGKPRLNDYLTYEMRRSIQEHLGITDIYFNTMLSRLRAKNFIIKNGSIQEINILYTIINQQSVDLLIRFDAKKD
jgi:hypothetical protein